MSEQNSFTPPDPEFEVVEFLQDIASERFLYQQWLEAAATEQKLEAAGYTGRLYDIPQWLCHIPGIAKDISIDIKGKTTPGSDRYNLKTVTIRTEDYPYAVKIRNDHGIILLDDGHSMALAPVTAQDDAISSLFSARDRDHSQRELVDFLATNSAQSTREDVFEGISENDNGVRVTMLTKETDDDSTMTFEVETYERHPSSLLVGTRLTMHDSLESAAESDSSLSILPGTTIDLDILDQGRPKSTISVETLVEAKRSIPIKAPKPYHEGHIIEALFALQQAAKAQRAA